MTLTINITTITVGIVMTKGLKGLIENSCCNNKLKRKVNTEGA